MTFLRGTVCTNAMNGSSSSSSCRRLFHSSLHQTSLVLRAYSSTPVSWFADDGGEGEVDEQAAAAAAAKEAQERKRLLRQSALSYNQQKAAYNRQVGKLRHQYKVEHARHEAQDLAERDAAVAATTRRRLERQRAKNERSFQNAIRQEELRRQNAAAFADHLKQQQEIRTAQQKLHQRARQLLIDELEEESRLWLTSKEEVEAAFDDPRTEQMLWARPQGILGVPNPSLDSHFWTYEGHTWDRSKTYKTKSQILLQQLEEEAYVHTNVDFDHFWTEEKLAEAEAKEDKAKLRANVRMAGRRALLQRQKDYLSSEQETAEGEPPKPPPIPSLGVLGNVAAQEKEGAEILLKDPTKFFVFADDGSGKSDESSPESKAYAGSSLGVPVAVRDPLRTGQPQGRVFPIPVGKLPKPDLRTEKEKKRQEREERLWAAAGKSASGDDANDEDLLLAEEDREIGEAIDYEEANANWDSDDEDWNKGLDEDRDKDLLNLPRELRYRHEDIDQVIERLEAKAATYQSHVQNTIRTMEQEARSRLDRTEEESNANAEADGSSPFFDAFTTGQLRSVGADVDKYERLMASLTHEQLLGLFALEANTSPSTDRDADDDGLSVEAARTQVFEGIPGLSQEQIAELTELESFIRVAETEQSS